MSVKTTQIKEARPFNTGLSLNTFADDETIEIEMISKGSSGSMTMASKLTREEARQLIMEIHSLLLK